MGSEQTFNPEGVSMGRSYKILVRSGEWTNIQSRGMSIGISQKLLGWGGGKSISYLGGRGVIGEIWDGLNIRGGERFSVLPLSFHSGIAFNWFQTDNKLIAFCLGELHCISTMGTFPHNIKGLSIILSLDKCHRLQPLIAVQPAPATERKFQKMSLWGIISQFYAFKCTLHF